MPIPANASADYKSGYNTGYIDGMTAFFNVQNACQAAGGAAGTSWGQIVSLISQLAANQKS